MSPEEKIRRLAQQSTELQEWFFTDNQVRWFGPQLPPKFMLVLDRSCVRVTRVSTTRLYCKETRTRQSQADQVPTRFQFDVLDCNSERARSAATAVKDWLSTVDFSSENQFASPATSPTRHPNFVLNERQGMEYKVTYPAPAYVQMLDVRIFNLEE